MFLRKQTQITLVVATRHRGALDALNAVTDLPLERREALTTGGLYHALKGAQLAIVNGVVSNVVGWVTRWLPVHVTR